MYYSLEPWSLLLYRLLMAYYNLNNLIIFQMYIFDPFSTGYYQFTLSKFVYL